MDKKKPNSLVERFIYLSKYDTKYTIGENLKVVDEQILSQQNIFGVENTDLTNLGKENNNQPDPNEYPNYCRYPEKAIRPKEKSNSYMSTEEIIEQSKKQGFCFYKIPSTQYSGTFSGLFLPIDSQIVFHDTKSVSNFVDKVIKKTDKNENIVDRKKTSNELTKLFLPDMLGSVVRGFYIGDRYYTTWITRESDGEWKFKGFFTLDGKKQYTQPEIVDIRNPIQKFIDSTWFLVVQVSLVLGTALLSATGVGSIIPFSYFLIAELVLEGTFGVMGAIRAWERGQNIAAALSLVTGLLPSLKVWTKFRGVNPKTCDSLSQKFLYSGLNNRSKPSDLVFFYNSLNEEEKILMVKIFEYDPITKGTIIDDIQKNYSKELADLMKNKLTKEILENKEKFVPIKYVDRLWVRELGINGIVFSISTLMEVFLGKKLNSEEKKQIEWFYLSVPDNLRKEVLLNQVEEMKRTKEQIENGDLKKFTDEIVKRKKFEATPKTVNYIRETMKAKQGNKYHNLSGDNGNENTGYSLDSIPENFIKKNKITKYL